MMAEYIEREMAVMHVKQFGKDAIDEGKRTLDPVDAIVALAERVETIPAADVAEVRHGEWVLDTNYTGKHKEIWVCSVCTHYQSKKISGSHRDNPNKIKFMNYCPYCGAKMDGKGEGE